MNTQSRDPLLERLDEILADSRLDYEPGADESIVTKAKLRQLMADVAIDEADCWMGLSTSYDAQQIHKRIRRRFGVGVEEKAK